MWVQAVPVGHEKAMRFEEVRIASSKKLYAGPVQLENLWVIGRESWASSVDYIAISIDIYTFRLRILSNVLSEILLPLQGFIFRHYASNDSNAPLPQVIAERLGSMIEVFEVDLGNDLGAKFDYQRNFFP
jgi:hypothetical protein